MKARALPLCAVLLAAAAGAYAQKPCVSGSTLNKLYSEGQWRSLLSAAICSSNHSADLDYFRGMALARLERWDEAAGVFKAAEKQYPHDKRFPVELAGIAFKQKRFGKAKRELHRALRLDPKDRYALTFLATLYFLDGNLAAALKYWNRVGKPRIADIQTPPQIRVDPALLDRAFTCSPASILRLEQYRTTRARLEQLGIFPAFRLDLTPHPGGHSDRFDLTLSAVEQNGWGRNKAAWLLSLLRGAPYETVYPEYFNLHHSALNVQSLFRWDDPKRRIFASVSAPLARNPKFRYQLYVDGRNENWDVSQTFHVAGSPLTTFNMEKLEAGGGVRSIVNSRLSWAAGLALSDRWFRDLPVGMSKFLFTDGFALEFRARGQYALLQIPEKRFTLTTSAEVSLGKLYATGFGDFSKLQGSARARWFPQSRGDDYEVDEDFHAGKTFGSVPFDELFILGLERDNNLSLRAHIGTHDGRKGSAPLGRDYLLSNWEINKNLYDGGWFKLRLAPFLDTGRIYSSSNGFGSRQWLWDTGGQAKLSVLGGVSVIFTYGKDLRTGNNTFYVTTVHEGGLRFLP
ncbi:MAG TPA: tetratricopeptide repeat protein [Terriglobia bacterium]|nr:tetratricopeptide repeat protein [Terriglobia bacterium]